MNILSAQYLLQCMDTENVCHHITKMVFHHGNEGNNLHQTLSNRVITAIKQRERHTQALNTPFVITEIDNMNGNRVFNNRPPPISDEETLL